MWKKTVQPTAIDIINGHGWERVGAPLCGRDEITLPKELGTQVASLLEDHGARVEMNEMPEEKVHLAVEDRKTAKASLKQAQSR